MSSPLPPVSAPTPVRRQKRERLLTRDFVLVSVANLLQGMSFFLFIHLPGYLADLGASEVEIGTIVAVTAIAAIAARPTIGRLLDTVGRRPVALAGGALNVLIVLTYLTVETLGPWLYVVRIIHGLAEATLFTSLFTLGADIVPASRRTEGLALFGVSGLLPIALGGLTGDLVLREGTFDGLFVTAGVFALGALLMTLTLREPGEQPDPDAERGGLLGALRQRDLQPIWWIVGMFSVVLTAYFAFMRTFVDLTGIGSVGLFFSAYAGTAVALRLGFAWLPERVGERRVLYPSLLALAGGFVVLASATGAGHLAIAGMLCGAGHGYVFPIMFGMTVTRASLEDRGSALALFTALFDVGTLAGGPILGAIIGWAGYEAMFLTAAGAMAAATAIYEVWDRAITRVPAAA